MEHMQSEPVRYNWNKWQQTAPTAWNNLEHKKQEKASHLYFILQRNFAHRRSQHRSATPNAHDMSLCTI